MVFFLLPGEIFYLKGSKKFTRDNQKDNFLGKYINIHELININTSADSYPIAFV